MTQTQTDRMMSRAFAFGRTAWSNGVNAPMFDADFVQWWDRQVFDGHVQANQNQMIPFSDEWSRGWNLMQVRRD